jgi:hypothetical protein
MGKAWEYRRIAWDCLKLSEAVSNLQTGAAMRNVAQIWVRLAENAEHNDEDWPSKYRAKAWECAARAQVVKDPEQRAELLRFAGMWLSLTEPIEDELRGAYELPTRTT